MYKCECGAVTKSLEKWRAHAYTNRHINYVNEKYPTQIRELGESDKFKNKYFLLKYRHFKTYVITDN